jgi:hypothetical protein
MNNHCFRVQYSPNDLSRVIDLCFLQSTNSVFICNVFKFLSAKGQRAFFHVAHVYSCLIQASMLSFLQYEPGWINFSAEIIFLFIAPVSAFGRIAERGNRFPELTSVSRQTP